MAITVVVFLVDIIELLRRFASKDNLNIILVLKMAALKAPEISQKIFPFSVLFGSTMFFTKMVKNQEFTAAQSSGQSIWQFLLPTLFVVILLGFFWISVFNPVSSVMTAKYETIENTALRNKGNALSVSSGGLWIRENIGNGHSILHLSLIHI